MLMIAFLFSSTALGKLGRTQAIQVIVVARSIGHQKYPFFPAVLAPAKIACSQGGAYHIRKEGSRAHLARSTDFFAYPSPRRTSASSAPIQEPKMPPSTLTSKKGKVKQPKKRTEPLPALTTRTATITNKTTLPTRPASAAEPRLPTQAAGESNPAATPRKRAACIKTNISRGVAGESFSVGCSKSSTSSPAPAPASPAPSAHNQSRAFLPLLLAAFCSVDSIASSPRFLPPYYVTMARGASSHEGRA